jgi:hypothetical protein
MTVRWLITVIAAITLVPEAAASDGDSRDYPVWIAPSLGVESVSDVGEHLSGGFWPEGGLKAHESHEESSAYIIVKDCDSLARAIAERRWAGPSVMVQSSWLMHCRALEMIGLAQPATVSNLRTFVFDEYAVDKLPAILLGAPGCDWQCRLLKADEKRIPISGFELDIVFVDVVSETELEIRTEYDEVRIEIVGRGDFNGDGADDVLVTSSVSGVGSRWGSREVFVLTRDTPTGTLQVVDPHKFACADYACQASYDEPSVLAE